MKSKNEVLCAAAGRLAAIWGNSNKTIAGSSQQVSS
jgi:hypothetical protein